MEPFRGSLAHYRLELLVPALCEESSFHGVLRLQRGGIVRELVLQGGYVVAQSSTAPWEHLAQLLVAFRLLEPQESARCFEHARLQGVPFGAYLVSSGRLKPERLAEVLEHKAREAFFDCYGWQSGEVELIPGPVHTAGIGLRLELSALHRDAVHRQKQWDAFRQTFPNPDIVFDTFGEMVVESASPEDDSVLKLAEEGLTLAQILSTHPEGAFATAQRVLNLYRRGALTGHSEPSPLLGQAARLAELLRDAKQMLAAGQFEAAAAIAAEVLERAPVPEAQALYREAEKRHAEKVGHWFDSLEGKLELAPLPERAPPLLTADDLYLYSRLQSSGSCRETLRTAPMGELAAYHSLRKLMFTGLVSHRKDGTEANQPRG